MEKNKKKGFTLVELIVTLAVSAIVLGMVASLSVLVNKILQAQRYTSSVNSEYEQVKTTAENFISKYSSKGYKIVVSNSNEEKTISSIYIYETDELKLVSKFEFQEGVLVVSELKQNAGEETSSAESEGEKTAESFDETEFRFSTIVGLNFELSSELNLLKIEAVYETRSNMRFLINLGGLEIGN